MSRAAPQKPISSPLNAVAPGRLPPGRSASNNSIHNGTVETNNADKFDGIYCAAQTTPPLPPTRRNMPMMIALRRSSLVGLGSPAARRQKYRQAPEIMKRAAADRNGGVVSTVKRIAR